MYQTQVSKLQLLLSVYPIYVRPSLVGGSILLIVFLIQTISGFLIGFSYSWVFDTGLPGVVYTWWETYYGSFLIRIHSEFGNIVFLFLYVHILIKIWNDTSKAEIDHTWLSGSFILVFTYLVGITGAIMPCSILAEVTATVIGYAINSLSFINFDFLSTPIIPGLGLTDDTLVRVFVIHGLFPLLVLFLSIDHLNNLHNTEYTDEDEMESLFYMRFEYWDDFIWLELNYWFELLTVYILFRFLADLFWPNYMVVTYSLSNFEFWPILEEIDFVLAIPHWYLRPLMSSLVVIPHHYFGFFYVILFFISLIFLPYWEDTERVFKFNISTTYLNIRLPHDLNVISAYFFILFILLLTYATLIIPTGRYFISLGSSEVLVLAFWYIIVYLFFFSKLVTLLSNEFFKNIM